MLGWKMTGAKFVPWLNHAAMAPDCVVRQPPAVTSVATATAVSVVCPGLAWAKYQSVVAVPAMSIAAPVAISMRANAPDGGTTYAVLMQVVFAHRHALQSVAPRPVVTAQ